MTPDFEAKNSSKMLGGLTFSTQIAEADRTFLKLKDAATEIGVTYQTLRRWIRLGKVTPIRILGHPYLSMTQIEALRNSSQ